MNLVLGHRVSRQILLRVLADGVMVAAALFSAIILRFLWVVALEEAKIPVRLLLTNFLDVYFRTVWLLLLVSLFVFAGSGFYTQGRTYRGRYKSIVVTQAVTIAYLAFGFLLYMLNMQRGELSSMPRGSLIAAWLLTAGLLVCARLWSQIWKRLSAAEKRVDESKLPDGIGRVLVIGGGGYIGSAVIAKLIAKGYNVRLLDLLLYGDEPIKEFLTHPRMELVRGDFRQIDTVVEVMREVNAVVHLGAIVGDPACELDEQITIDINLMATRMIAEVAKGYGIGKFVFASTCSVYGASDLFLDEKSALNPVSLYARSKIASEKVLLSMASASFAPTILRFGTIYGLSGRPRFDLVINTLTAKAVIEGQITVINGDQWRPFVHVQDAALAVLKALEAPSEVVAASIFNVGSDAQNFTIRDVGRLIQKMVPSAKLIESDTDGDRRNYRVDFRKIRTALGFQPDWTVEKGVEQVIAALRSGAVTDYRDSRYSNVKFLSEEGALQGIRRNDKWVEDLVSESNTRRLSATAR
jgi:nucleoside-diphosphate-sugar epimerase